MNHQFEDIAARQARLQILHVGILVFPGVEVLDFAGPFEVFSVAARVAKRELGLESAFKVSLIGAERDTIAARHGMGVLPHHGFDDTPPLDLLVVPGGLVEQPRGCARTLAWIRRASEQAALTASVCTGAALLAQLGLLDGLAATTHWEDIAELRAEFPQIDVRENTPWVDQGRIVSSAGISAGIGMSLHLVERVLGATLAAATARQMEYDWTPSTQSSKYQ
ncbi:DJ-1/PfpI family protein [Rugamonas sp. DEMB1]|uniref:DJ-1/PfpI family protein n=1 Tax=Rugamonas sp. DEMB1 TaxID=3039386 RepID=UPI00244D55D9|nr:DJ-1/PfpI family protein [Rugamonas sp. DEMB1]WGG50501.1 DJ-1/PfpI family protein [Rugamonas sp. DEMB1]